MRAHKDFYTVKYSGELTVTGDLFAVNKSIGQLILHGSKIGRTGEFTKRCFFLMEVCDLSQAEAVMDLIRSTKQIVR